MIAIAIIATIANIAIHTNKSSGIGGEAIVWVIQCHTSFLFCCQGAVEVRGSQDTYARIARMSQDTNAH